MTVWRNIQVGELIELDGDIFEVKVIKAGGVSARVILEPIAEVERVAKKAIKVRLSDQAPQPEGAESDRGDKAAKLVEDVLGGTPIATVHEDETMVCPLMDVTLIATHLKIMHGVELKGLPISGEDELMRIHKELHEAPFHEPAHPHIHEEVST